MSQSASHSISAASAHSHFNDYHSRCAEQTLRRQEADLLLFREFVEGTGIHTHDLFSEASAWRVVSWTLVEAFNKWQLEKGYALTSVNVRLSSIKSYARLAMQVGTLTPQEYALIRGVQGYTNREQTRIDQHRQVNRIGTKKSQPIKLTPEQAEALKDQPDTPQGRRDTLMMCLLLDHGLRVSEASALSLNNFDLTEGVLRFSRVRVNKEQIQPISPATMSALNTCMAAHELINGGLLLRRSKNNEGLGETGMSDRAITGRVHYLGEKLGILGLSANDCRYYWSLSASHPGNAPLGLHQNGEWSSLSQPGSTLDDNEIVSGEGNMEM
jgi:site-specific recombinase XerD